jgi:hypothetical protein
LAEAVSVGVSSVRFDTEHTTVRQSPAVGVVELETYDEAFVEEFSVNSGVVTTATATLTSYQDGGSPLAASFTVRPEFNFSR